MGTDKAVVLVKSTGQRTRLAEPVALTTPVLSDDGTEPVWIEAGGDITTDTAWAAKGDLIAGTGNNTAAILTAGTNGKLLSANSAQSTGLEWVSAGAGMSSGSAFPGSPSSGDLFYRTDLHLQFYYDGTRWLSLSQYAMHFERNGSTTEPISVTTNAYKLAALGQTIYIQAVYAGFFIQSGGTALGASHKWVLDLHVVDSSGSAGAGFGTVNIDSGSSNVFRQGSATGLTTATVATDTVMEWTATKTGTPGNLQSWPRVLYRIIAT